MAVMNLATLHWTAQTRFLPHSSYTTKTDLVQGTDIPTPKGTDPTPSIMVPDMGDISAGHSPVTIPILTGEAVSEGTHHTPHPATAATHAALQPMEAPITTHTTTHPISIVTSHPTLTTSPMDITHATIPWTRAPLAPATPIALHRNHSQEKPSQFQDFQLPINPTIPRLSPSWIPLQILPQIQTEILII